MLEPPGTPSRGLSAHTSSGRVPLRWLTLARSAWIICSLLLLANFVISIPAYFMLIKTVCTFPNQAACTLPNQVTPSGQLTSANIQALAQWHISATTYAAYFVIVTVVVSLLYWGVGLLIFWRKSDEGMGLFVSLLLILFGATGITDNLLGTYIPAQPPLLLQLLLFLISGAQWMALYGFLLTFPTGRFVPRWSWLLIPGVISYVPLQVSPLLLATDLLVVFGSLLFIVTYRYVRVFDAVQRQQTKWFVYFFAVGLFLGVIISVHSLWRGDRDSALPLMEHRCHHQPHIGVWQPDCSAVSHLLRPHLYLAIPTPRDVQTE